MSAWFELPDDRKKLIFEQTGARLGLPPAAVEKDWWVTLTLQSIFELPLADRIVFKGGTSLSKGWNLIQRFSEDIDLAIDRESFGFAGSLGKKKITKLRKTIRNFVLEEFTPTLEEKLKEKGADVTLQVNPNPNSDADPSKIEIQYPELTDRVSYLPPRVLVELSARSLFEPFEGRIIGPIINPMLDSVGLKFLEFEVPCVLPQRTFLEKIFLLHEEFQRNEEELRAERLSRHLYDLHKMMDENLATSALQDEELYKGIIAHRGQFTRLAGIDYTNHLPGNVNLIPPPKVIALWEADYRAMQENMIQEDSVSFGQLMKRMEQLMERVNAIKF
ncbi:MAG: nucleotidyl transferase AbiEii/AbiGii toxin family protein [Balneola sp.]|nr:MAG: nucleotidyl transferase AbiEii/AbiGii toxin family protein [Balneola sp.]